MSQKLAQQNKKPSLKQRLDIYKYDQQLQSTWNLVQKHLPQYVSLYKKYDNLLVNQSISKVARLNNLKALLSLGKILKENDIAWETITRDQVNEVVSEVMKRWADPDGKETWHTKDHKKFLMQFVRWLKTGRRKYSRKHPEPEEILDINCKKVAQKLTREDMITQEEEQELLEACGENLRDKALIALHAEAGSRAGETLNIRIGHIKFLDNGGAIINVDGKTGDRPIHVVKSVPYLAAWLEAHPFKDDKTHPYWIDLSYRGYGNFLTYPGARTMIMRRVEMAIKNAERLQNISWFS